jgi:hypothetical protein
MSMTAALDQGRMGELAIMCAERQTWLCEGAVIERPVNLLVMFEFCHRYGLQELSRVKISLCMHFLSCCRCYIPDITAGMGYPRNQFK